MSLFHHHEDENDPAEAEPYEVLTADRRILRYSRDDFAEIMQTTDLGEVKRRTDGLFGHGKGDTVTSYTMGLVKEGAQGVPGD